MQNRNIFHGCNKNTLQQLQYKECSQNFSAVVQLKCCAESKLAVWDWRFWGYGSETGAVSPT